jgi:hypothetical protein
LEKEKGGLGPKMMREGFAKILLLGRKETCMEIGFRSSSLAEAEKRKSD